ncbi:flagellar hook capping FlgD N-terminal domain-containing protein [Alphaproteobacteria bacterium]|jgi:flagellar basal-body rod modification protein FlgD|nr:flagellar biosynthesis protein FlgJ [Alphaproteobacteria bacterium]MDC0976039.1 flagellar hook capping FlgD N-terminal domain-containing protein [Alphaproteobacteria bacterium]MDC1111734.1 flagellar hook capping FlgD N-terminal domain-containing protein [Alphaproteobacteria bacterium]|tara:strand:+ start:2404 stop:3096 length:693 start_codon:yes stop_codon:yes gene_type:complete
MSEINSSNQSLTNILDKLGINASKEKFAPKETKDQLGQDDFLKLMTTQLQNQDPFAPVDNADFIAQMAQFSTVTGITSMDQSIKSISDQLSEMRIASTTQLMGHSVLVPGKYARPDKEGIISGVVDLPETAGNLNIIFESSDGQVLHQDALGMQKAGLVGFEWKDLPEEIKSSNSPITIRAFTGNVGDTGELSTQVFASVSGTSKTDTGVMLEVEDYGTIDPSQVVRFKN